MTGSSGDNSNKSALHFLILVMTQTGKNITKGGYTDANGHGNFRYALPELSCVMF